LHQFFFVNGMRFPYQAHFQRRFECLSCVNPLSELFPCDEFFGIILYPF
jgi:hypothetical protein